MIETEKLYYYTDFNTFKLILQHGTLRFKESTSSNDRLDTVQLYDNLLKMAEQKCEEKGIDPAQHFYFDMLQHNGARSSRLSLVACFTSKADSRLLWDAYTMHRKDRAAERYNGVCIEFDPKQLIHSMNNVSGTFDVRRCHGIIYGFDRINHYLEKIMDIFSMEVDDLSKDENQSQNIIAPIRVPFTQIEMTLKKCLVLPMLHLIDMFDSIAPYFKHSFWREECETRALLSIKTGSKKVKDLGTYPDGSKYFDLSISGECITKVILGPEFSENDISELLSISGAIPFSSLVTEPSEGTNVITNR